MIDLKYIIYCYILGDSFGLSKLCNDKNESLKLVYNDILNIDKGYYSSMTSFMLSVLDSIGKNKDIIPVDILNKMCTSLIIGKYTNNGKIYDLDEETLDILKHYMKKNNLNYDYNESDMSSYSLSRIIPLAIYYHKHNEDFSKIIQVIGLTTSNEIVILGNYIMFKYIINLLNGNDKYKALKIDIPDIFKNKSIKVFKDILKGNIFYKEIKFNDNIVNVLKVIFYVVLHSDNYHDMLLMINSLIGKTNIYSSFILFIGSIIYGKDELIENMIKDLKNKKDINKYIKDFEKVMK